MDRREWLRKMIYCAGWVAADSPRRGWAGAMAAPEFEDSGNAGMLDLALALAWVRDRLVEQVPYVQPGT